MYIFTFAKVLHPHKMDNPQKAVNISRPLPTYWGNCILSPLCNWIFNKKL